MGTTSGPASNEPPTEVEIELQEAVRAEERLLDAAPSLEVDGPRVRAELDAGPTEQTAITANLIQESLIQVPHSPTSIAGIATRTATDRSRPGGSTLTRSESLALQPRQHGVRDLAASAIDGQ
jgi:hypothetical protein